MTLPAATNGRRSHSRVRLYALLTVGLALAVYGNTLLGEFVYDDDTQVLQNPWIRKVSHLPDIFRNSVWSFDGQTQVSNYYRPMMHTLYMLTYHVFGPAPWGFHLVNILLHAAVCLSVFFVTITLLRRHSASAGDNVLPAFAAAALFATHPVHTEAVCWIAGVPELSFTLLALLSFSFHVRSLDAGRPFGSARALSLAAFALALLCKETALVVPVILAAYDHLLGRRNEGLRPMALRYLPYAAIGLLYLLIRVRALGGVAPEARYASLSLYELGINVLPLFQQYLGKLLLPSELNAFHVFHPIASLADPRGLAALGATAVFGLALVLTYRRSRLACFYLVVIVAPLLPVFYIPGLGENTFAERYLYLPSLGYVSLVVLLTVAGATTFPRANAALEIALVSLIGLYSFAAIQRNAVWRNDEVLFRDTIEKSPDSPVIQSNLATMLLGQGRTAEAVDHYQAALRLNPDRAIDDYNLGVAYERLGRTDDAIGHYQAAGLATGFARPHNNLGVIYAQRGALEQALQELRLAVRQQPNYATAHFNLATACLDKGLLEEAVEHFRAALEQDLDSVDLRNDLGLALFRKGEVTQAVEQYRTASRMDPTDATAHARLAAAYERQGRLGEAIEEYATATRLDSNNAEYPKDVARLRARAANERDASAR